MTDSGSPQDIAQDIAALVSAGAYDPGAPDAPQRLAVLVELLGLGADPAELAVPHEQLPLLLAQYRLRPGGSRLTLDEAAAQAGVSVDQARRISRAAGLPDVDPSSRELTTEDVEVLATFAAGAAVFGEDLVLQFARVIGMSVARIADAAVSIFAVNIASQTSGAEPGVEQLATANDSAISLLPSVVRTMDVLLRRHIAARSRDSLTVSGDWEGVDTIDRAVGFCDLVGYTSLSGRVATRDLADLLSEFGALTSDVVAARGAEIVKLIGDEAMFVARDARTGCDAALALAEAFAERRALPPVRVGLAAGRVMLREGDYFGPVVNLAARLVKVAEPGSVVVPDELREHAGAGFEFVVSGPLDLKGFDDAIRVAVLRRATDT